jgi:hypothetical protein
MKVIERFNLKALYRNWLIQSVCNLVADDVKRILNHPKENIILHSTPSGKLFIKEEEFFQNRKIQAQIERMRKSNLYKSLAAKKKDILVCLGCVILLSCGSDKASQKTIVTKEYMDSRTGICHFSYREAGYAYRFQDSCHYYFVGDSIQNRSR